MEKREFKQYSAQWTYLPTDAIGLHDIVNTEIKFFKDDHYMYSKVKKTFYARPPSEKYNGQFILLEWFDIDNKIYLILNETKIMDKFLFMMQNLVKQLIPLTVIPIMVS